MPAVPITSMKQYERAIEVLDRVGGSWQGVGFEERFLLVSPRQAVRCAGRGQGRDAPKSRRWLQASRCSPRRRDNGIGVLMTATMNPAFLREAIRLSIE